MASSAALPPWHSHLTIDLLADVASYTVFHPFVAWIVPLCLRAQATPYTHLSFQIAVAYAALVTLFHALAALSDRLAYGAPRHVDLEDEVIVITGGASGLGLLIAEVYGMRGASVAVLDVADMPDAERKGISYYRCDVGDRTQVEQAVKQIELELGTPTILINNAAIVNGKPLLSLSSADISRNFNINLLAHYHTLQLLLPGMLARPAGGTVVTVASVLGYTGAAQLSDYTAAKAALVAMHTSLRAELRQMTQAQAPGAQAVRTILVTPGQLATPLFAALQTPSPFLAPVVEPVQLARDVIRLLDAGRGGRVSAPLYAGFIEWLGVMPEGLQTVVRRVSGVDSAMRAFGKEKGGEKAEK